MEKLGDKWHAILAFIGGFAGMVVLFNFLEWYLFYAYRYANPGLNGFLPIPVIFLTLIIIHILYESWDVENWEGRYKTKEHAEMDSKEDWRWFWRGLFFSLIPYAIFLIITWSI